MIEIYKIGKSLYRKDDTVVDKNSGYYEYLFIQEELKNIVSLKKVLIIINGKFENSEEEKHLLERIHEFDIIIFVMTDIISLTNNINIIDKSDYLLHQCPNYRFPQFAMTQKYSYIPEMFYKYSKKYNDKEDNLLIFGGGTRDNESLINEYLSAVPSVSFLKTDTKDNRLCYHSYLRELRKHKYALIVSRKQYSEIGWVTARFVEAIANGCVPIVDATYDMSNHFMIDKVHTPNDVVNTVEFFNSHPWSLQILMYYYDTVCYENCNTFAKIIQEICDGN